MDIMHVIDKIIVPAQREGRLVFTNGGQWVIKTNCDIETLWVDITTLTPEVRSLMGVTTLVSGECLSHCPHVLQMRTRPTGCVLASQCDRSLRPPFGGVGALLFLAD